MSGEDQGNAKFPLCVGPACFGERVQQWEINRVGTHLTQAGQLLDRARLWHGAAKSTTRLRWTPRRSANSSGGSIRSRSVSEPGPESGVWSIRTYRLGHMYMHTINIRGLFYVQFHASYAP